MYVRMLFYIPLILILLKFFQKPIFHLFSFLLSSAVFRYVLGHTIHNLVHTHFIPNTKWPYLFFFGFDVQNLFASFAFHFFVMRKILKKKNIEMCLYNISYLGLFIIFFFSWFNLGLDFLFCLMTFFSLCVSCLVVVLFHLFTLHLLFSIC